MSDLRELYQQTILDHNRAPRNFYRMADANRIHEGYNPLCGDHLTLYLKLNDSVIEKISFEGSGCAISKASASIMSSVLKGRTVEEAEALFHLFHQLITSDLGVVPDPAQLGKLAVFAGVREFPARVKCASLAWHTMLAALRGEQKPSSTE
jgi:nitrogen fixation NifU-like protein